MATPSLCSSVSAVAPRISRQTQTLLAPSVRVAATANSGPELGMTRNPLHGGIELLPISQVTRATNSVAPIPSTNRNVAGLRR